MTGPATLALTNNATEDNNIKWPATGKPDSISVTGGQTEFEIVHVTGVAVTPTTASIEVGETAP